MEQRVKALCQFIEKMGEFGKLVGDLVINASFLSQMVGPKKNRPITEKNTGKNRERIILEPGYFDGKYQKKMLLNFSL